jgi:hypothetical protein
MRLCTLGLAREKKADWDPRNPQPTNQREMDDVNNYCGRQAGKGASPDECLPRCLKLLQDKTLIPGVDSKDAPTYGPLEYRAPIQWPR